MGDWRLPEALELPIRSTRQFADIRMMELGSPGPPTKKKKLQKFCSGRVSVLLHSSLYKVVKLTYPTDFGGIVPDGRMTAEVGTGCLGQSVAVLSAADFRPACE